MKVRFLTLGHEASPSLVVNDVLHDENGCFQASDPAFLLTDAQISGLAQQSPKKQITAFEAFFSISITASNAVQHTWKATFKRMFSGRCFISKGIPGQMFPRQLAAPPPPRYCGSPGPQRYPGLWESSDSDFTGKPDPASPPYS